MHLLKKVQFLCSYKCRFCVTESTILSSERSTERFGRSETEAGCAVLKRFLQKDLLHRAQQLRLRLFRPGGFGQLTAALTGQDRAPSAVEGCDHAEKKRATQRDVSAPSGSYWRLSQHHAANTRNSNEVQKIRTGWHSTRPHRKYCTATRQIRICSWT